MNRGYIVLGPSGQREAVPNSSQVERENTGAHIKDAFIHLQECKKKKRVIRMNQSKK